MYVEYPHQVVYLNDIWRSPDGRSWTQVVSSAPWSGRYNHTVVVFRDTMWLFGGHALDATLSNDVWYSSDGTTWARAPSAPWPSRECHAAATLGDRMWLAGGYGSTFLNDVWYTDDGFTWTQATSNAGWQPRADHKLVDFDDKLWVIGGGPGDIWTSADGTNWQQSPDTLTWGNMSRHTALSFQGHLWVLGGGPFPGSGTADVWVRGEYTGLGSSPGVEPEPGPVRLQLGLQARTPTMSYSLSRSSQVQLEVFSTLGSKVAVLDQGLHQAGTYCRYWDWTDNRSITVPAGAYVVRLLADGRQATCKLVKPR
jgi:hypothetical protein